MDKTNIKFIMTRDLIIKKDNTNYEDNRLSYNIYECCSCHWRFVGDCTKHSRGYEWKGIIAPNYCPMCGKKITDIVE